MSLTQQLVAHLEKIDMSTLSSADIENVRTLLLDHLAVVANGSQTESARTARRFVSMMFGPGSFPIIGTRQTAPPLGAALANGVAGHSIEYDDVHNASSSHPGVVIFPAALAAAAIAGAEAEEFLVAVVKGYEAMCRVGRAAHPPVHYGRHFHPTATTGHFGAATAAASLLGLDRDRTVSALGIAGTMAAGSMEFLADGAWTKRLHPGLAARNGVEAALLAAEGFQGPQDGIAGERGFLAAYSAAPRRDELLAGWGERALEVRNTSIKAHACCRYNQGPIDCLLEIRGRFRVAPEDVAEVTIGLPRVAVTIVAEPHQRKIRPRSVVDAQFSLPFAAAVTLARGRAGLAEYTEAVMEDRLIVDLMRRVRYEVDPDIDAHYPAQWRSWATVTTTAGQTFTERVYDPKGDPTNPVSLGELREKFEELTEAVWGPDRRDVVARGVLSLGEGTTLHDLMDRLAGSGERGGPPGGTPWPWPVVP